MTRRWWMCLVVALAAPMVQAQTAPVAAPEFENADVADDVEDASPIAPSPPPALPAETPSAPPFANAVWASGHWFWDGSEWRFNPGTWIAQMPGYQFVNGYWRQEGSIWRWISGGWARPGSLQVEFPIAVTREELSATQAPPQLRAETPPPPPAPHLTWAPGYWYWSGANWVWVEGSWVEPPRPGLAYVSPKWIRRGPSWVFMSGGWAPPGSLHVSVPLYRHSGIAVRWGHPNYFLHSWDRYRVVRHDYWHRRGPGRWHDGRRYDGRRYDGRRYDGPRHHDAGPVRHHRGGRHDW
ncbi:hypothetical protein [Archangium lipolyticum]|uniref:hypothetical protein n=1 Tax=Archangium lipolyticum TaxID=2970465 RepID=UPI00214A4972|nr:hypothetical protein [Archangium lipolyticum]